MNADPKSFKPRNIAVFGRELALAWADGHESYLPFDDLRRACPCAMCRGTHEPAAAPDPLRIVKAPVAGQVAIAKLVPVGSYAVQIVWSDGHDTGIYAFESLREACPCPDCRRRNGGAS
ncbi:MAG TPA: DUF971 domain-containing protein [Candidatus Polarisedimenticolaceae bacterium]|nr:DUF971 domain-containing protein [Candidatus Polarisedimenticolaceae bacterium]